MLKQRYINDMHGEKKYYNNVLLKREERINFKKGHPPPYCLMLGNSQAQNYSTWSVRFSDSANSLKKIKQFILEAARQTFYLEQLYKRRCPVN
jgi:hypothetical protein